MTLFDRGRSKTKVSVVMSTFNCERFLPEAVDSILTQSFEDFEFIVINDGSTDATRAILDRYQVADARMRVYHEPNRGIVHAVNRGCSMAQGKYIARMDSDDISVRDRLLWQVEFMETHPEIGLLGGAIGYIDERGHMFRIYQHPLTDEAIRGAMSRFEGSFCNPSTMMRKDVFVACGGYRRSFEPAEDYDLWLRIGKKARLGNLDAVVLQYRIHSSQVSQRKLIQQGLGMLGANHDATSRGGAEWEALASECLLTPEMLSRRGVSEAMQQQVLITRYRDSICTLSEMGDNQAALSLSREMFRCSRWKHVRRSLRAHLWLITASLYRRQGQMSGSLISVGRAVALWPLCIVRPVKPVLKRVLGMIPSILAGRGEA